MTASETTTQNELAWLANRYVAGELSADETAAFEARLETDVAACSEVARAMELNLAIVAAFDSQPKTLSPQPGTAAPPRRVTMVVTALAATAVAAAGVALMIGHGSTTNGIVRKDGADRIVAAWATGEAARNDFDDDDSLELADDSDLDPPDWMLAALTSEDVKDQLPSTDEVREN
jgi:ferric-dicitrate binding protein FerR (iron transport regulator)